MFKRIISLMLVMIMACGVFTLSVSAYDPLPVDETLLQEMKDAYIEKWLEDYECSEDYEFYDGNLSYFHYLMGGSGLYIFQAAAIPGSPVEPSDVIGNYRFTAPMCMGYCDTNPAGMYVYDGNEVITLREAYDEGLVDLDWLFVSTNSKVVMTPLDAQERLENKCRTEFMEELGVDAKYKDEVYIEFASEFENYTVFRATVGGSPELITYDYIGGYWFWAGAIYGDEESNPTGLYTLDNYGNIESLKETADKGFIDMDSVYPVVSLECEMYMLGDINNDTRLNIKDATLIQKYIAKIPEAVYAVNDHFLGLQVINADLSGGVGAGGADIRDVTYIQKIAANMIIVEKAPPFDYNNVILFLGEGNTKEYTLEDFPEYEFESIEMWGSDIVLRLENPGRTNVVDAVNSLKYREGEEFYLITPEYIPTSN